MLSISSNFGLIGDSAARCHLHSDGSDKATHANVQLSVYLGHQMHTGRVREGGSARLLSLLWHTARHEYTISDDSFYYIRISTESGEIKSLYLASI